MSSLPTARRCDLRICTARLRSRRRVHSLAVMYSHTAVLCRTPCAVHRRGSSPARRSRRHIPRAACRLWARWPARSGRRHAEMTRYLTRAAPPPPSPGSCRRDAASAASTAVSAPLTLPRAPPTCRPGVQSCPLRRGVQSCPPRLGVQSCPRRRQRLTCRHTAGACPWAGRRGGTAGASAVWRPPACPARVAARLRLAGASSWRPRETRLRASNVSTSSAPRPMTGICM